MKFLKKTISVFLTALMVFGITAMGAVNVFADTYGDYTYSVTSGKATVSKYNNTSYSGALSVPSSMGGYPVTAVDDFCFSQAKVTSVTIPNSVVSLGDCAFEKCSNLASVTFGAGLKEYGTNVFSETPRLSAINVSSSNSYFKSVSGVLFNKSGTIIYAYPVAKSDTEFTVPNSVSEVEHYAFDGADNLKELTIGTGMTKIGDLAFIGASNVEKINILGEVTYIGNNAFGNINKLQSISLPDTVTYIGKEAFQDDNSLKNIVIPSAVSFIGVDAFEAVSSDFLIYCYTSSYAVTYCETYNIQYELIDSVLSSIAVTSQPSKTRYCVGESIDTSGLIISAVYSNGISRTVTGYKLSDFDSSSVGTKSITVSYTDNGVTRASSFTLSVGEHEWDSGTPLKEATCTEGGTAEYTCKICGTKKVETTAALGHEPVDDVYVEPTCTESGMKDIICNRCGEVIESGVVVPALGHISNNYTKYIEATCTAAGEKAGVCSRCGETFDDVIPALGHNYKETVISPTCTQQGVTILSCTRCGDVKSVKFTAQLEHNYVSSVKEATCTTDGYTVHECKNCGQTYIDNFVSAYNHSFSQTSKQPTCTDSGYTEEKCSRCGMTYYDRFFNALGHNYVRSEKKATSTTAGYVKYTCSRCGEAYYESVTEALGPTSVEASAASSVQVGKSVSVKTSLTPNGIIDRVYFKSSNTNIATVSAYGSVTGKNVGKVKIRCYLKNGKYKDVTISVTTPSTSITTLTSVARSRLKISWNMISYSSGYVVQYSRYSSFKHGVTTKYISGRSNTSATYRNLAHGKRYYVRVAAYKTVSGKKYLSSWSKVKNIKVK